MAAESAGLPMGHDAGAQAMLAAIVESSSDAIIGKTLDGVITSWNAGAQRMYGYTAGEITGHNIAVLIPPDRADEMPSILAMLRQGLVIEHFDTYRVHKDGTVIPASVAISPIRGRAGVVIGAASVAREMTDRDRSETDRWKAEARFRQAERMETVGQLAGGVAHDFNNLLGAITAYAGFLADGTADRPGLHSDAAAIQSTVKRAATLVQQLLTFSRNNPGSTKPTGKGTGAGPVHRLRHRPPGGRRHHGGLRGTPRHNVPAVLPRPAGRRPSPAPRPFQAGAGDPGRRRRAQPAGRRSTDAPPARLHRLHRRIVRPGAQRGEGTRNPAAADRYRHARHYRPRPGHPGQPAETRRTGPAYVRLYRQPAPQGSQRCGLHPETVR